jgi:alkylhydroperoxidase family enzyme
VPWLETTTADTPLQAVLATHPELMACYQDFAARVWADAITDPVILELVRIRVAQMLGCDGELMLRYQPAIDAGLTEDMVDAIRSYPTSAAFTQHQRNCLSYAESWVMDAHAVTDELFASVAAGFTPREMMGFVTALAMFDGADRMRLMLDIPPAFDTVTVVPAPRRDGGPLY